MFETPLVLELISLTRQCWASSPRGLNNFPQLLYSQIARRMIRLQPKHLERDETYLMFLHYLRYVCLIPHRQSWLMSSCSGVPSHATSCQIASESPCFEPLHSRLTITPEFRERLHDLGALADFNRLFHQKCLKTQKDVLVKAYWYFCKVNTPVIHERKYLNNTKLKLIFLVLCLCSHFDYLIFKHVLFCFDSVKECRHCDQMIMFCRSQQP